MVANDPVPENGIYRNAKMIHEWLDSLDTEKGGIGKELHDVTDAITGECDSYQLFEGGLIDDKTAERIMCMLEYRAILKILYNALKKQHSHSTYGAIGRVARHDKTDD